MDIGFRIYNLSFRVRGKRFRDWGSELRAKG
jgi:hypothetical protein